MPCLFLVWVCSFVSVYRDLVSKSFLKKKLQQEAAVGGLGLR